MKDLSLNKDRLRSKRALAFFAAVLILMAAVSFAFQSPDFAFAVDRGESSPSAQKTDNPCALTDEMIAAYTADGTLDERVKFMNSHNMHQVDPGLISAAQQRNKRKALRSNVPTSWQSGMSTVGDAHILAIRVEFEDKKFDEADSEDALRDRINGSSDSGVASFPYESLNAYYERASYGQLHITGDVKTYHAPHERAYYSSDTDALFKEALTYFDKEGVDLSSYDANGDGFFDGIYLHFAGEAEGWGSPWWSYRSSSDLGEFGGLHTSALVMLHESSATEMGARTIIHETGHVLGLPDLYYYGEPHEDKTGTLTWDMMETNLGDIDAYCKWLLGWIPEDKITRVVVTDAGVIVKRQGEVVKTVTPPEGQTDCNVELTLKSLNLSSVTETGGFIVVSNKDEGMFSNFFLVEYEQPVQNSTLNYHFNGETNPLPSGFRIYQIQGQLSSDGSNYWSSNTGGSRNTKFIEMLDFDQDVPHSYGSVDNGHFVKCGAEGFNCYLSVGSTYDATSPVSTNFGQNIGLGYTGIAFTAVKAETDEGTIKIGYKAVEHPDFDKFELECLTKQLCNNGMVEFQAPWLISAVGPGAQLIIDGKTYEAGVEVDSDRVRVEYLLPIGSIRKDSVCQLIFPEGMFNLDPAGPKSEPSKKMTFDLEAGPVAPISENGMTKGYSFSNATFAYSNMITQGDNQYCLAATDEGFYLVKVDEGNLAKATLSKLNLKDSDDGLALPGPNGMTFYNAGNGIGLLTVFLGPGEGNTNRTKAYWIDLAKGSVIDSAEVSGEYSDWSVGADGRAFYLKNHLDLNTFTWDVQLYSFALVDGVVSQKSLTLDRAASPAKILSIRSGRVTRSGDASSDAGASTLMTFRKGENNVAAFVSNSLLAQLIGSGDLKLDDLLERQDVTKVVLNSEQSILDGVKLSDGTTLLMLYEDSGSEGSKQRVAHYDEKGQSLGSVMMERLNTVNDAYNWSIESMSGDDSCIAVSMAPSELKDMKASETVLIPVASIDKGDSTSSNVGLYLYLDSAMKGTWTSDCRYVCWRNEFVEAEDDSFADQSFYYVVNEFAHEPEPDPDPTPDPKPDPEPDPGPQPTPTPDPDPTPGPNPTPDPNPQPSPDPDPDPNSKPDSNQKPASGDDPAANPVATGDVSLVFVFGVLAIVSLALAIVSAFARKRA